MYHAKHAQADMLSGHMRAHVLINMPSRSPLYVSIATLAKMNARQYDNASEAIQYRLKLIGPNHVSQPLDNNQICH